MGTFPQDFTVYILQSNFTISFTFCLYLYFIDVLLCLISHFHLLYSILSILFHKDVINNLIHLTKHPLFARHLLRHHDTLSITYPLIQIL